MCWNGVEGECRECLSARIINWVTGAKAWMDGLHSCPVESESCKVGSICVVALFQVDVKEDGAKTFDAQVMSNACLLKVCVNQLLLELLRCNSTLG